MSVYVVTDIFGLTPALQKFVSTLSKAQHHSTKNIHIVDPYEGKQMNFANEADAYAYFAKHIGVEQYAAYLHSLLVNDDTEKTLIGFSVGASAIWTISDNKNLKVDQAVYFYGSQIRHLLDITPQINSTVILPHKEEHFCVDTLQFKIESLSKVSTKRCEFFHGFMNKHSVNFNQQAYTTYTGWLCQILTH